MLELPADRRSVGTQYTCNEEHGVEKYRMKETN